MFAAGPAGPRRRSQLALSAGATQGGIEDGHANSITGVDFVGMPTHDLETAVEFYGETLGLPRSVYMPERNYAEFETGNLTLSVIDAEKIGSGAQRQPERDRAARRRRGGGARRRSRSAASQFTGDTLDTGVCHMAFFADPDGNALMLHHRYAPRD